MQVSGCGLSKMLLKSTALTKGGWVKRESWRGETRLETILAPNSISIFMQTVPYTNHHSCFSSSPSPWDSSVNPVNAVDGPTSPETGHAMFSAVRSRLPDTSLVAVII